MKRASWTLALLAVLATAVAWYRLFHQGDAWARWPHWGAMIGLSVLGVATLAAGTRHAKVGIAVACTLLGVQAALIACSLAGVHVLAADVFPNARLASVVGVVVVLAMFGLVRRRVWGRWLGAALGAQGAVSGGLNAYWYWKVDAAGNLREWECIMWVTAIGGALILANAAALATPSHDTTWSSRDRLIGLLRATIIAAFVAGLMLLVYAWLQPIAPETRTTAFVLAAALAVGGVLAVRGKLAGALVLVVAGIGLVAQTAITALDTPVAERQIALYYAVF
ncbi:MAG TPA: hypothetical protein VGF94_28650, partial [Kofleriaceae bacterium]